jgi:tripartite-type tricarboxylate transporter receptor subunit TctC
MGCIGGEQQHYFFQALTKERRRTMFLSKIHRIALLAFMATFLTQFLFSQGVLAQKKYPDRPVDLMVPMPPGGGADQFGRKISPILEKYFGKPFPVANFIGAGGNTAMQRLQTARPDGYTMSVYMGNILCSWAAVGLGDFKVEDFVWLARMIKQNSAMFVKSDSPIKDANELIRLAKEKELKVAFHGVGSYDDISVRYLVSKGLKLVGIPYAKPSERYAAPLGGHTDLLYEEPGDVRSFLDSKQIRPILFFSKERSKFYPDIPTTYELGYQIAFPNWRGVVMKSGIPEGMIKALEKALMEIVNQPVWKDYLKDEMAEPDSFLGPVEFSKAVIEEYRLLDAFAREFKIKKN